MTISLNSISPLDAPSLVLWLDASDASTITLNGSNVAQWDDKSGNNFDIVQGTANNQPAYTSQLNNLNIVTFDGTSDYMRADNGDTLLVALREYAHTVFMVTSVGTFSVNKYVIGWNLVPAAPSENSQLIGFSSSGLGIMTDLAQKTIINEDLRNTAFLETVWDDGTNIIGYRDGVEKATIAKAVVAANRFTVGAELDTDVAGDFFPGDIAELIIYSGALTASRRVAVENYLIDKWGL